MCGRYTLATPSPDEIRARFPIGEAVEVRPRYNVAPGDDVLAVTTDREGQPRGELLHWGLVPSWAKSAGLGLKMINARAETVAQRPAYRRSFEHFRCLIPADGFYEWRPAPGGPKQAFHITRADGELFAFAGLWSVWRPREGEDPAAQALRSCTIVTTAANPAVAPLHDRMPVILPREVEAIWLDATTPTAVLLGLLRGLAPEETALHEVGSAVNDARHDAPDCLAPPVQAAQAALF